jgi:DNA replication protein DnaC
LPETDFTELAHNAILVGGPGTGKSHVTTAIRVSGINLHARRGRFHSTADLVNALRQEKFKARPGAFR